MASPRTRKRLPWIAGLFAIIRSLLLRLGESKSVDEEFVKLQTTRRLWVEATRAVIWYNRRQTKERQEGENCLHE